ncbi:MULTISPECIES: lysis system i-spanin subunit Rz [Pseudomonas chlororaphis group]|uniref:lysis system i-spanin subunit Rz n=1 Tax=Pseudomonas chlororaphis group TaxID=136842 RepID=UPI002096AC39|nr:MULTISPECIES: lysis system i-spanin subunit Rz [Pseudomonas chlororaphis group]MCO7576156.1 lysis protein [Pseudomonas protegens]MCO7581006.1 lysis protein [Pseudomonas chlororaphis]MCO7597969.1 lysis protein [Pseudomonas chlororaphis]
MIQLPWRIGGALVLIALLMAVSGAGAWQWQANSYGKQLAEQARLHGDDLAAISNAAADQVRADQDKRLALEQRLSASDQTHYKEMSDAQTNQARLRDRLATADMRLSVLIDATDPASGCSVPAGTEAVGVVHGGTRARLDPAHAQRIVAITDAGDQGLIALAACQAYVREVNR